MDLTDTVIDIQNEGIFSLPILDDGVLEEPVEILVQLAKRGEIDPWNVDIVDVTDKFLKRVEELELMDLRMSGRTLHYAAILLRMKSEYLVEDDIDDNDMEEDDEFFDHFDVADYPIPMPPVRRKATRPVTLLELIEELTKAEAVSGKRRFRNDNKPMKRIRITTEDVMEMAHDENIESSMVSVRELLENMFEEHELITFSELSGISPDKVITFISLLFLATKREVWLEQEELFGELYIRRWSSDLINNEIADEICN